MAIRTSITISEDSKKKAEEIKNTLPYLKSFGAVVEYCITQVHQEVASQKIQEDTFAVHVTEVFRALNSFLEKSMVNCPESPQEIERKVRKYIHEQAEKWGKRLTPQYVDELVKRVMELHSKTR